MTDAIKNAGSSPNLLPALVDPQQGVDSRTRGQLRSTIVQAAQQLNDARWGAFGTITGTTVRIDREKLWVNPCSVEYSDPEIDSMAASLRVEGQKTPLVVVPAVDQRTIAQGGFGGEFMILDGKLRWLAAPRASLPTLSKLECVVQVYDNPYEAAKAGVIMKASLHGLDDDQAGPLLRRLHEVYREAKRRGIPVGEWPKQEEWAARFGRTQPTIARWMGIARLTMEVQDAIDGGAIREYQAAELIGVAPGLQQAVMPVIVASNAAGTPMSSRQIRNEVAERTRGPAQTPDTVLVHPPQQLRLPFLAEEESAVEALRILLHDSYAWLGGALEQMEHPDSAWMTLYRAMNQPKIRDFMQGDTGSTTVETD